MPPTPLAYSYQRFSSPEQGKGDSLRRQDEALRAFLTRHSLRLDESLRMVDAGVSGFKGKHRDDTTALGHFLSLVQSGRVPRGSYLIVESLDRLSREEVKKALKLLLGLLEAEIRVVQLFPTEVIYDGDTDPIKLIIAIVELSRGNSESQMKSIRVGAAWDAKRAAARATGKAVSASCPKWLRRVGDRYELIPDKADTVRRIFELAGDGWGVGRIAKRLREENRSPFWRAKGWNRRTLYLILTERTTLGEYQPTKAGSPIGDPIRDYYPAVVTEEQYLVANAGLKQRKSYPGRPSRGPVNLFTGLLYSAFDGDAIYYTARAATRGAIRRFVNANTLAATARRMSFPIDAFEEALLATLKEVTPADIEQPTVVLDAANSVATLSFRLEEIDEKIAVLADAIAADPTAKALHAAASKLDKSRAEIEKLLEAAKLQEVSPASESLGQCHGLIEALKRGGNSDDLRLRLRTLIRRLVTRIDCLFVKSGCREAALAQIRFRDRDLTRTVRILYRRPLGNNRKTKTPAFLDYKPRDDGREALLDLTQSTSLVEQTLRLIVAEDYWHRHIEPDRPTAAAVRREAANQRRRVKRRSSRAGTAKTAKRKTR